MLRRFISDRRGVSAIEFALIVPFLMTLMLGLVELQRYIRLERRLTIGAHTVAQMVAQRMPNDTTPLNVDLNILDQVLPDYNAEYGDQKWHNLGHQITSVVFRPTVAGCTKNCTYNAFVDQVWPAYGMQLTIPAAELKRDCGQLQRSGPGDDPSKNTIATPFGPGSVIVVDLKALFKPIFASTIFPSVYIVRQGYASPRFAMPSVQFPVTNPTYLTVRCPTTS